MLSIGRARVDDVKALAAGYIETLIVQGEEEYLTEAMRAEFERDCVKFVTDDKFTTLVARKSDDDPLVGFIVLVIAQKTPYVPQESKWWHPFVWVSLIFVDSAARGSGLAKLLMERAEEFARNAKVEWIYDDVYDCNERSWRFHEKLGFEHFGDVVRRDVDVAQLRADASARLAPDVLLRPLDASRADDVAAIRRGLIDVYAVEGDDGIAYSKDETAQDDEVARFLNAFGAHTVLATKNDEIVGWVVASLETDTPYGVHYGTYWWPFADLSYIWVSESFRALGLSTMLLEQRLTAVGQPIAISSYTTSNVQSARWHEKNGFRKYVRIYRKRVSQHKA
jgi:GNAT superfamily N-acetyltransferase